MTDNTTQATETELRIPSIQPNVDVVGILHRKTTTEPRPGPGRRRLALILHGLLAHKNQCYHRALAQALPIDSFRFDFRGNGDSKGDWTMGNLDNDVADLSCVVRHLCGAEGYAVDLIVAHSRGSMVSWMYLSRGEEELERDAGAQFVPKLVVASGRWAMDKVLETYARFQQGFDQDGFYRWQITSAGQKREYIVWPQDLAQMAQLKTPTDFVQRLSDHTDVLILHGTADKTVDQHDAHCYLAALDANPGRAEGKHRLQLVDGADHMYRGCTEAVVKYICDWYAERGGSKSGGAAGTSTSTSRL